MALVGALAGACKEAEVDPATKVASVVAASVRHESAMLGLLESHRTRVDEARRAIVAYARDNDAELTDLAHQRELLEREPSAFATAVQAHHVQMTENLARRRRLLETAAELMADPDIKATLARLSAL